MNKKVEIKKAKLNVRGHKFDIEYNQKPRLSISTWHENNGEYCAITSTCLPMLFRSADFLNFLNDVFNDNERKINDLSIQFSDESIIEIIEPEFELKNFSSFGPLIVMSFKKASEYETVGLPKIDFAIK